MIDPVSPAVVVRRLLPAVPDVVFDEWLDPVGMTEWMCPRPARAARVELDARVGGRFVIDIDDGDAPVSVTGEYLELRRPHWLRFTWWCSVWAPTDPESVVTVTLAPHGDADTLMTIHHAQLPPTAAEDHRRGWSLIGDQLDGRLRRSPGAHRTG